MGRRHGQLGGTDGLGAAPSEEGGRRWERGRQGANQSWRTDAARSRLPRWWLELRELERVRSGSVAVRADDGPGAARAAGPIEGTDRPEKSGAVAGGRGHGAVVAGAGAGDYRAPRAPGRLRVACQRARRPLEIPPRCS